MYALLPPSIYIFERALADPLSAVRVERMLRALGRGLDSARLVTDADIPEMIRENDWLTARRRQGVHGAHRDPALVFSTLRFEDSAEIAPVLKRCPTGTPRGLVGNLLGHGGRNVARENVCSPRGVCRARVQFDTIFGCPHGCAYCRGGRVAVVNTNLEAFIEKQVRPVAEQERWQNVFMYNSALSDTPCFEPEYGLSRLLAEFYASTADQHYLIHTKSGNVDWLLDLAHRGRTILLWSLTSETVSREIEPGSALPEERIEAARRCQQAGYPIRFKLKPVVPVKGWRDEYRETIRRLLSRTRPESIGLFMLAWMDAEELFSCIDETLLDAEFVDDLRASADTMSGVTAGPFSHASRAAVYRFLLDEIRRHDVDIPVFLCTETVEMWREFSPVLGLHPGNYICGCGPQCKPGMRQVPQVFEPLELRETSSAPLG